MGYFTLLRKQKLLDIKENEKIEESDFCTVTPEGDFVQFIYHEEEYKPEPYQVKPGVWSIQKTLKGLKLESTSFVTDSILENFVNVTELTKKIDCFFRNLHVYKRLGIEIPRRAVLLWGSAGTGKTTALIKVCQQYSKDNKTAIILWSTDKIDPSEVKDFFKSFQYVEGVKKIILVAEDIGGVEAENAKIKSTSSLLSLLDNKEKIFQIPIFIIATTNFPENLLANITNRPGRFDDKIKMDYPDSNARYELFKFFSKGEIPDETLQIIKQKKYSELTAAHLHEIVIRSAIYEITPQEAIDSIMKEISYFKKEFQTKKQQLGIKQGFDVDDDDF